MFGLVHCKEDCFNFMYSVEFKFSGVTIDKHERLKTLSHLTVMP